MSLEQTLSADIVTAMRAKDATRLTALRMLKTALTNKSIEKGRALETAEELQVVSQLVKQRRDSIEQFTKGGRKDLADKEQAEIAILEEYLPAALSEAEIGALLDEALAATGATNPRDMGKVMGWLSPRIRGRADGKVVSGLVASRLAQADLAAHDRSPH